MAATLPSRVLALLRTEGPSYARAIAHALDSPEAPVSGALASLQRRGLVAKDGRQGRCVIYRALEPAVLPTPAQAPLSAFDIELAFLRAVTPGADVLEVLYDNRGLGNW